MSDWKQKWAEMTDEERAATGIIIEEHILTHGKCYTVRGREGTMFTIREDGFIAGKIEIANDKPMTCENFVRMLAEFARAARFFEWTEEDKTKGRSPVTSLMGLFMGWGTVPVSTFAEVAPQEGVCPTCGAGTPKKSNELKVHSVTHYVRRDAHGTEGHTEEDSHIGAGQGHLQSGDTETVCEALPRPSEGVPERGEMQQGSVLSGQVCGRRLCSSPGVQLRGLSQDDG